MDPQRTLLILLTLASALLPLIGLVGLYRSAMAQRKEYDAAAPKSGEHNAMTIGQFNVLAQSQHRAVVERPFAAKRDLVLIGGGIGLAAAASIWSLFV
ncbi:hypothetical protein [Subtercola frigoramans]|uniref:Uncharacterized protein n=1 Tax=Subtercola frigoramans TaxID=120298 RepID=A0ABS2L3R7_9MICO|nr:hypothetical protein [Subtercola frigoramans]MBM7471712.1 hypothetical protein [Subtercola frigoramans]